MIRSQPRRVPSATRRGALRALTGAGVAAGLGALGASLPAGKASAQNAGREALTFFRIGTGPAAETLYGLGTAISAGISRPPGSSPCDIGGVCGVPGLIAVAQSRGDSAATLRDMRDGNLESALVHADMAYWAFSQGGPFSDEAHLPDLRVIADLVPVSLHLVVRRASSIESVRDLRGRRVSIGASGSSAARIMPILLRQGGVDPDQMIAFNLAPGPASDRFLAGEIDAFVDMGAPPIEGLDELARAVDVRLLPIDPESTRQLLGFFPFLRVGEIPQNAYPGTEAAATVRIGTKWVCRADMPADFIEDVTRALWQSETAQLFNLNNPGHRFPSVAQGRPDSLIPVHPGAARYYDSLNGPT
jgi:TRAP transporter TAXI family solute receptor